MDFSPVWLKQAEDPHNFGHKAQTGVQSCSPFPLAPPSGEERVVDRIVYYSIQHIYLLTNTAGKVEQYARYVNMFASQRRLAFLVH